MTSNRWWEIALSILISIALAICLLASGFGACLLPFTTEQNSTYNSNFLSAPYAPADLTVLAVASRDFTVDFHEDADQAAQALAATVIEAAGNSSVDPDYAPRWTLAARSILANPDAFDTPLDEMYALAALNQSYGLSAESMSHLQDCNNLIVPVNGILLFIVLGVLVGLLILIFRKRFLLIGRVLWTAPLVMVAFILVALIWGLIDWYGLFSFFHAIFFPQGNWTFPATSLLILMYPSAFWQTMGAVWVITTLVLSILVYFIGFFLARSVKRKA